MLKYISVSILTLLVLPVVVLAFGIDSTQKYAWSEKIGWINFSPAKGNVQVSDAGLTGYAWSPNYGWINLAPTHGGVKNDGAGNLSGSAWGESTGWIDFSGVTIDTNGKFTGQATGQITGRINFDCTHCAVVTDWRSTPAKSSTSVSTSGGGSGQHHYSSLVPTSTQSTTTALASTTPGETLVVPPLYPEEQQEQVSMVEKILTGIKQTLSLVIPGFNPSERIETGLGLGVPLRDLLPKQAPAALAGNWNLVPPEFSQFAMQPLPLETRILAQKFPAVASTLSQVGISKLADVSKLESAKLALPGFDKVIGLSETKLVGGRMALMMGVPVSELSMASKMQLPTEVVFTRALGERLDLATHITFNDRGLPAQQVSVLTGKTLNLVVKPDAPVNSVKGYIVLSKTNTSQAAYSLPLNLTAVSMFAAPKLSHVEDQPLSKEDRFVLSSFDYSDAGHPGIFTADVPAPLVPGNYEVITVMDYKNPDMGKKEIRLIAVVDPEGYVFTKDGPYEARIPNATVSLYWLNSISGKYELWPAKEYLQDNPQVTDSRGTYSFLVPEGSYYLTVAAPGFKPYRGDAFAVTEGAGVHTNLELTPEGGSWWSSIDWKTMFIIMALMVIIYQLYKSRNRREPAINVINRN